MATTNPTHRFFKHVQEAHSGCWKWTGASLEKGYGVFAGDERLAHRYSWTVFYGPIPKGMEVHHTCEQTWCVNPIHLTLLDTTTHRLVHIKDVCRSGHLKSEHQHVTPRGDRYCKECRRIYAQEYRRKRMESSHGRV